MLDYLKKAIHQKFSAPESIILLGVVIFCILIMMFLGTYIAPILAAIVIGYLLDSLTGPLERIFKLNRCFSVTVVYCLFIVLALLIIVGLIPILWKQFSQIIAEAPAMLKRFHDFLQQLPLHYPSVISKSTINDLISGTNFDINKVASVGKVMVSASVASLPSVVSWVVYLFLIPLLVLFFLKDKNKIVAWFNHMLPKDKGLVMKVSREMRHQLGAYVHGRVIEIILVSVFTYWGFWFFGLQYASLLSILVGLSVVIPYIGLVVVSIPVIIIGLVQFGTSATFCYMIGVYFLIQLLDGNVLVPLLFAKAIRLHPIAIIAAVLIFGGIWGFWGLFFAIPLAALVKSILSAWANQPKTA